MATGTLTTSGAIAVTGSSTINASGGPVTFSGTLTGTTTTTLTSGSGTLSLATVSNSGTFTIAGVLGGSQVLTKSGAGILILSGASTYSAGTSLSAGKISLTNGSGLGAGTLAMTSGTILDLVSVTVANNVTVAGTSSVSVNSGTSSTLSGVISGSGILAKKGAGTLVLSGTNTYTGGTSMEDATGTISLINNNGGLGSGTLTMDGNTLALASGVTVANTINLTSNAAISVTGTATLSGALVSGTAGLIKSGTGTLVVTNSNAAYGGLFTRVFVGTLALSGSGSILGTNFTILVVNSGATFDISGVSSTASIGFLVSDDTGGTVSLGAKTLQIRGGAIFPGVITGSSGNLTIDAGSDTVTLSGAANTYSGTTTVTTGILQAGINGAFSPNSAIVLANDSTVALDLSTFTSTIPSLTGGGASGGNVTFSGGALTLSSSTGTFSGAMTGSGTLTISGGTFQKGSADALSSSVVVTLANTAGVTFDLNGFNQTIAAVTGGGSTGGTVALGVGSLTLSSSTGTFSGTMTGSGTLTISGGTFLKGSANAISSSSTVTLANTAGVTLNLGGFSQTLVGLTGGGSTGGTVTLGAVSLTLSAPSGTYSGAITGTGGVTLSSGTFTLAGASLNTYSGATTVNGGTFGASAAQAFSASSAVVLANTAGVTLALNNTNNTILSLSGGGTTGGTVTLGSGNLTFGDSTTVSYGGTITGTGAVTKQGSGQVTLTNSVIAQGGFTVAAGTLVANNTINTGSNNFIVSSGALLKGNTTITAGTTVITGGIAPGNSIGTTTILGDYSQTGTYYVEITPTENDLIDITGTASVSGTVDVTPQLAAYPSTLTVPIITSQGLLTGEFTTLTNHLPSLPLSLSYDSHNVYLTIGTMAFTPPATATTGVLTGNAAIVAVCVDAAPAVGDFGTVVGLLQFSTLEAQQSTFSQMSSSLFNGLDLAEESAILQVRKVLSREMDTFCAPNCFAPREFHAWIDGFYTRTGQNTKGQGIGYHSKPRGVVAGIDYIWEPTIYSGAAVGYTRDDVKFRDDMGKGHIYSYYGALYAGGTYRKFYAQTALMGAGSKYHAVRNIDFHPSLYSPAFRQATHEQWGWEALGNFEAGYSFGTQFQLIPYGTIDYAFLHRGSFEETGANSIDLDVESHNSDLLRFETGLEFLACCNWGTTQWMPHLTAGAAFERRFMGQRSQASFVGSSCVMSVTGLSPNRCLFLTDVGLTGSVPVDGGREDFYFTLDYEGEWGSGYYDNTFSIELSLGF